MGLLICGAKTRSGMPCKSFVVAGGKRCRLHGGYSTGPVTLEGKLRCAENMRRVRIDGAPGVPKGDKWPKRRAASIERRKAWLERQDRKRARAERWRRKQLITAGLPLWTEAEL